MSVQLDTNILTRLSHPTDPAHGIAGAAVAKLAAAGQDFIIVPQNLYEWWTVATRPIANNGLGLSVPEAHGEIVRRKALFPLRAPPSISINCGGIVFSEDTMDCYSLISFPHGNSLNSFYRLHSNNRGPQAASSLLILVPRPIPATPLPLPLLQ